MHGVVHPLRALVLTPCLLFFLGRPSFWSCRCFTCWSTTQGAVGLYESIQATFSFLLPLARC
ncbi:hypothetical protein PR003_g1792 [Phytophthora rubi]|uniref:Secreted protein n=1 Tax=Phytophthora rubi TaxID=129364 RepID=A0A6A3P7V3_9STRA|nr:hypothetical protein PR002_g1851 [Phytophthora rubi]KAE9051121.1 hypothetical protein PR001_g1740 [Phytophthora rubi]KAE9357433.1 hypothetical protein PR003_g1792 [Phytophthora rubi]